MTRRTPLALAVLLVALSTLAPGRLSALRPAPAAAAAPTIGTLVVFTPGIDPFLSNPSPCPPANFAQGCYDPYERAVNTFSSANTIGPPSIMDNLGCAHTPTAGVPFAYCSGSVAWIPYSYLGVTGSTINTYPGAATGQSIATAAGYMQQLITFAKTFPEAANAKIVIVAHSLGGVVGSYWAGQNNSTVPVITLDSPVSGIWVNAPAFNQIYCNASVGLFANSTERTACNLFPILPAVSSPAAADLNNPAVIAVEAKANSFNIANTLDNFVASWFAIGAAPKLGQQLITYPCSLPSVDPVRTNHFCVLIGAANAVANYITNGVLPTTTPINRSITLNINVTLNGAPLNAQIQVARPGQIFASTKTVNGNAIVTVPWIDSMVTATYPGGMLQLGALPGADTNLFLPMAGGPAPSKSCSPASPPTGTTTVCTVTLTAAVLSNANLDETVTGPSGATITDCGNGTGGLNCSGAGNPAAVNCTGVGGPTCPAGSSFQVTISSTTTGSITETLRLLPFSEAAAQTWTLTPNPPAAFGTPSSMQVNGTASINGAPAPAGTTVNALVGATICGSGTTSGANGAFSLTVASASQTPGCGTKGAAISFTVGGAPATPGTTFTEGGNVTVAINAGSAPLQPMQVSGTALLNGSPAAGATVQALVAGTVCGTATTVAGGSFQMSVNSATQVAGCGTNGATVTFTINGHTATPTATFTSGGQIKVTISANNPCLVARC